MSPSLKQRLQADLIGARKGRDKARTVVLSTALSEIRNREIELGHEVDDAEIVRVLSRGIKQRRDAADMMRTGGREELALREEAEAELLSVYLPAQLSDDEVRAMIREIIATGASGMGDIMGRLMPRLGGRFDGSRANSLVREEVAG